MKYHLLAVTSLLLLIACGSAGPEAENPEAEDALLADTLFVDYSIGAELGDSTDTFGILSDAEYHEPSGNIIVLDTGMACLKEYTPDGSYLRQVSRQGNGPGELSVASFEFFQMGGMVLVANMMKQGYVVFDDSLHYLEEIQHWPQNPPLQCVALNDSVFAAYKPDFDEGDGENFLLFRRIVSFPYGAEDYGHVFWAESTEVSLNDLINNGASDMINDYLFGLTLGGNEDVVLFSLCESEEYIVHCWAPDGGEQVTIEMDLEPVAKTEEEIADEKAFMDAFFASMGAQGMTGYEPEPFRDMILKVDIGPDGNIWVQRGTHYRPLFDVFDLDGRHIGNYVFEREGWTWNFSISEEGILAWENDPELGYQQLHVIDCSSL